jgi:hypothetical protein
MAQPPKPPPRSGQDLLDGLEAATADLDNVSLVDLAGDSPGLDQSAAGSGSSASGSAPTLHPEPGERDLEVGKANLEIALDRDPGTGVAKAPTPASKPEPKPEPAPSRPSPEGPADLALDFGAAGLDAPVKGQSAPGPTSNEPTPPPPTPPASEPAKAPPPRTRAPGEKIGLFGEDRVFGFLVGGAIGLLVGIYPALQSGKGLVEEETRDAMVELEDAVERPLAVRAGDVRSPGEIAADIERTYGPARSRFWLVWLGIAIPVGAGLGLIRRPA